MKQKNLSDNNFWNEDQRRLIYSFVNLNLYMTPQEFIKKWQGITYVEVAEICEVETTVVYKWMNPNPFKRKNASKYYQLKLGVANLFFDICTHLSPEIIAKYLD